MHPTRNRNLIWLASRGSVDVGDRAGAARWEAQADRLYVQITSHQPDE
jgi:hypothetical protein